MTFRISLAGWKPLVPPAAGCGSMRSTSQSPAGAPDQAPAGTVTVVVSLVERSDMVVAEQRVLLDVRVVRGDGRPGREVDADRLPVAREVLELAGERVRAGARRTACT